MPTLTLVRHGQASLGAQNYDQLSELGQRQCQALGQYLHQRGQRYAGVLRGTLRRHEQSLQAISSTLPGLPEAECFEGLNEYDAEALVRAAAGGRGLPAVHEPEARREHFRLLRQGLLAWMSGEIQPAGMPTWPDFAAGVATALNHVLARYAERQSEQATGGGDVLLVSSGGPISTAVAQVLQAPSATVVALNLQMRNCAVTEFAFNAKGHALKTFNTLPHLDSADRAAWITYA